MTKRAKVVGRDAFIAAARAGRAEGLALRKAAATTVKAIDVENRAIDFNASTPAVDRMGDSIPVEGWEYANYLNAPVVIWNHDSSLPPIAKALWVAKTKTALVIRAQFMEPDLSRFADSIFRMYQKGFLTACSVGFLPIDWDFAEDEDRPWGIDFKRQELLELSCCAVPANPEALVIGASVSSRRLRASWDLQNETRPQTREQRIAAAQRIQREIAAAELDDLMRPIRVARAEAIKRDVAALLKGDGR